MLFVAGEPSGDQHGAHLVRALTSRVSDLDAYGVGGPEMEAAGLRLVHNITELSVIGLVEVAKNYFRLKRVFNDLLRRLDADRPDAVVLIDYPGFNLRLAKRIKKAHPDLPVIYFVSPQIWAWGHRRIHTIRRVVDLMLVLFPFEVDVYEKGGRWVVRDNDTISIREHHFHRRSNLIVKHVGHPLTATFESFTPDESFLASLDIPEGRRIVALLPGSRENEVTIILPVMLECAQRLREEFSDLFFIISCARPGLRDMIDGEIRRAGIADFRAHFRVAPNSMYDIAHHAELVLVASGTAAFEAALMHKPILVLYKINYVTFLVARALFTIPFINLANIIAGRRVVPEFIQHEMTAERIVPVARQYLADAAFYERTVEELKRVRDTLGHGNAGANAAREVCAFMKWDDK